MGDLSPHFSRHEFACRHCGQVRIAPGLIDKLERLRAIVGRPLIVVSGYRCPVHNRNIGGARYSRHMRGEAVDLKRGYATVDQAKRAGFGGVGYCAGSAVHVDLRPGWTAFPDC